MNPKLAEALEKGSRSVYAPGDVMLRRVGCMYDELDENLQSGEWNDEDARESPVVICLPHSCDEWVIGNIEQAKQLISDLEDAITTLVRYGEDVW